MANNLTGEYDAVLQVSVRQINGLLATLHQNKAIAGASPTFLHNSSFRVGATPTDAVRGGVQVQLSNPKISLQPGATSQLTASLFVRARYIPDADTQPMPAPVHGEVQIIYEVKPTVLPSGQRVLDIPYPAQDERIVFLTEPGTGLTAADEAQITAEIRKTLRTSFRSMQVPLPADFAFFDFKAIGSSPGQAIALPLQLSSTPAPPGAIQGINNFFLVDEFAIAVSKEHVETRLGALIALIKSKIEAIHITVVTPINVAIYTAQLASGPTLTWRPGGIDISAEIDLVTDSDLPNQWIRFKQALILDWIQPSPHTFYIVLKPDGEPDVDESTFVPHNRAVNEVKLVRDQALIQGAGPVNQVLVAALDSLNRGLSAFDIHTRARFTGRQVTPDGLIVYGAIDTRDRTEPVASVRRMTGCSRYTAFESWIPAGRITNYHWSLFKLETVPDDSGKVIATIPWAGETQTFPAEPHHFLFSPPPGTTPNSSVCLRIDGTRLTPNGIPEDVSGYATTGSCAPTKPEPAVGLPPGWMVINLHKWWPDPPFDAILDDYVYAHVSAVGNPQVKQGTSANHLVYFADWDAEKPLQRVHEALGAMRTLNAPLIVDVVIPPGGLHATRREVEGKLGLMSRRENREQSEARYPVSFELAEDYLQDWRRVFGVDRAPAAFLMNSRGEQVWNHRGALDPVQLTAAFDKHLVIGLFPYYCMIELAVRPGMRVAEFYLPGEAGQSVDLRRQHGRRVILSFWQSWSKPCINELLRLQRLQDNSDPDALFIAGICVDREARAIAGVRERYRLTIALAHDAHRKVSEMFDICCWPTTVSISPDGIVSHVQFGMSPSHRMKVNER